MSKLDKEISEEIPEEWELIHLIDLSKDGISNGVFNDPDKRDGKFKLINVVDLYEEPYIKTSDLSYLDITEEEYERNKAEYGDIFFTRSSLKLEGIAHCNILLSNEESITYDGHIMKLSPDSEKIDPLYLRYYCISGRARNFFMRLAKHTTMTTIGQKDIAKLPVPIPDREEQIKIVSAIKLWDEAIYKTEKLIKAKKRYKKGLMQRLLSGKVRFPEFEGEDWVEMKLGEVFDRITEKNESESVKNVLTISAQDGLVSQTDYYNKSVASKDLSNYIVLKREEFAYNKSYSEGYPLGAIKRLDDYEKGVLSPLYICFRLTSGKVDSDFITHFFEYGGLDHGIYKIAREGARNHGLLNVSVKDFFEIDITLPQYEEQKKIASVLNEALKEIELLESQLEKYQLQKKGLMQQLLTGKVRVN